MTTAVRRLDTTEREAALSAATEADRLAAAAAEAKTQRKSRS